MRIILSRNLYRTGPSSLPSVSTDYGIDRFASGMAGSPACDPDGGTCGEAAMLVDPFAVSVGAAGIGIDGQD